MPSIQDLDQQSISSGHDAFNFQDIPATEPEQKCESYVKDSIEDFSCSSLTSSVSLHPEEGPNNTKPEEFSFPTLDNKFYTPLPKNINDDFPMHLLTSALGNFLDQILFLIFLLIYFLFALFTYGIHITTVLSGSIFKRFKAVSVTLSKSPLLTPRIKKILEKKHPWKENIKSLIYAARISSQKGISIRLPKQNQSQIDIPRRSNSTIKNSANDPIPNHFLVNHKKRKKADHSQHDTNESPMNFIETPRKPSLNM